MPEINYARKPNSALNGFTLIELSIVLVVIGLVIGGILVGRELIISAHLRAQVTQITRIAQALNTFRTKYNELPGDICNNSVKFGLRGGCGNAAGANRDNGIIDDCNNAASGLNSPVHNTIYEPMYFFGNLSDLGLIPASYLTGTGATGSPCQYDGSGLSGPTLGYYTLSINPQFGMVAQSYQGNIWVYLGITDCEQSYFGSGSNGGVSTSGVLTATQASAIDSKMDDGLPGSGNVLAFVPGYSQQLDSVDANPTPNNGPTQCVLGSPATAYNLTKKTFECRLLIKLQ